MTKKQKITIAAIVLVGLIGGAAVLLPQQASTAGKSSGHEEHAHDNKAGADKEHAHGEQDAHKHADEEHQDTAETHEEGVVKLTALQQQTAGIQVQTATAGSLQSAAPFQGEIKFNDDRTAHVVPRLAGVAESVPVSWGQSVQKGQVLAVIASTGLSDLRSELITAQRRRDAARTTWEREGALWREKISAEQDYLSARTALQEAEIAVQNAQQKLSAIGAAPSGQLNRLEIRAPFAGTVVEKHLSLGESVAENASIFTISDLANVWAEFAVAPKDLPAVRVGQKVRVSSSAFDGQSEGVIAYVGALLGEQSRKAVVRVNLSNPQGVWRPGLYVTVAAQGEKQAVALAVSADALQTIEGQTMVFVVADGGFKAQVVKVGRQDGHMVEILDGLKEGDSYASGNTFVLKSELGKAGAEHSH